MYLAGTKPEQKINNGEEIGGAPARKLTVAIPMYGIRNGTTTAVLRYGFVNVGRAPVATRNGSAAMNIISLCSVCAEVKLFSIVYTGLIVI
jgi:hypothetical protein